MMNLKIFQRHNFSPILMAICEQWPFKGGKLEKENPAEPLAQWISKFLYLLKLIGEDERLLTSVRDSLVRSADLTYQQVLKDAFLWKMGKEKAKEALKLATGADFSGSERSTSSSLPPEPLKEPTKVVQAVDLEVPPAEDEKHTGLTRWRKKDIEERHRQWRYWGLIAMSLFEACRDSLAGHFQYPSTHG